MIQPAEPDPFVYFASQDLKAPLLSVKGLLYLMKHNTEKENRDHYLRLLETSVDKIDQSISDMIDYLQNEQTAIVPQEVDLTRIVHNSIDSLASMEDFNLVRMDFSLAATDTFLSDPGRLHSLFNNIISNAIRYRDKTKKSFLKIEATVEHSKALIIFRDNGIGIEEIYHEQIFEKFFRVQRDHRGSGLGLYIVKRTVEKLNGSIKVKSTPGEGTTFTLELPNLTTKPAGIP